MHRFVLKPRFNNLSEYQLKYTDILTYVTIRSFYNTQDKYCFPSYDAIAKSSGLSKKFIAESIKRLECASFLDIWRIIKVRTRHCYKFTTEGEFHKIPFQIFDEVELSASEKSMLLLLREHCDSFLECSKSISEIANASGLTYRLIHSQLKSLLLKGYVVEFEREDPFDKTIEKVFKLTDKINWDFPGSNQVTTSNDSPKPLKFDLDAHVKMCRALLKIGFK